MSSVPPDYVKAASFTTLAQQPITTAGLPGTQLDNEFVNISTTVNKTIDRLSELQQDDGKLRSNVVTIGSLSPETAAAIAAAGSTIYGEWVAGKAYKPGDIIVYGSDGYAYMAAVSHTSGTDFNADFSNKAWAILGWRPTTNNLIVKTFTGNGSQLTFELLVNPVSETNTQVFVNGVYKSKSTYDISGTNLVFTAGNAPANAAAIEVVIGVAAELISNIVNIPANSVGTSALINLAVTADKIADTTITTGKIADQAITAAKIENNTITAGKIQDLSISESKITNAAVTGQKIATGTIVESNLADSSVGTTKIAAGAILNSKMAANSVGSTNIIDGSITTAKIIDGNITTAKILDSNVTAGKIATDAVTTAKIADANVTTAKIADASITAAKLSGAQTGDAPIFGARAAVDFNADAAVGGFCTIRKGLNVSSVKKTATGRFEITLTTTIPSAYVCLVNTGSDSGVGYGSIIESTSTGSVIKIHTFGSLGYVDWANNNVIVIG
jgi:hypothetical protein